MTRRMEVQFKFPVCDLTDRISILRFFTAFETTYDENSIHKGADRYNLQYFVKNTTKGTNSARKTPV